MIIILFLVFLYFNVHQIPCTWNPHLDYCLSQSHHHTTQHCLEMTPLGNCVHRWRYCSTQYNRYDHLMNVFLVCRLSVKLWFRSCWCCDMFSSAQLLLIVSLLRKFVLDLKGAKRPLQIYLSVRPLQMRALTFQFLQFS